jgi:hypothetical protein
VSTLRFEIRTDGASRWRQAGLLAPGDQEGSVSDTSAGNWRDVIMFACHGGYSVIRRSAGGADCEIGPDRVVMTYGIEELARLRAGEAFELDAVSPGGIKYRARWTHIR